MVDNTVVEVDYWENQTYKQLQGGWSVPYYGVQRYSDSTGKVAFKQEKIMTGTVFLPLGWEWVDKSWEVDKSGKFGECDAEGWSYATTFEILVENTRLQALKVNAGAANMMRRRRWIRNRRCVITDVVKLHLERVNWADGIRQKIKDIQSTNESNRDKLNDYNANQKEAIEKVVIATDNNILDTIHEFNTITEKLNALRAFLVERGTIEESYAQKMDLFSKKWINEGDARRYSPGPGVAQASPYLLSSDPAVDIFAPEGTAAAFWNTTTSALKTAATATTQVANNAATAANYAATAATVAVNVASSNVRRMSLTDVDITSVYEERPRTESTASTASAATSADANAGRRASTSNATEPSQSMQSSSVAVPQKPSRGILDDYYYSVSLAQRTVGQRLQQYAHMLTHALPEQVDGILEVVRDALAECRNEGREIRTELMTNSRNAEQRFATYCQCFEQSQMEMKAEGNLLFAAVHQSSATIDFPVNDPASTMLYSLSALTGAYGDATAAGDASAAAINRFGNLDSIDLWYAIQLYFSAATNVDSVLLMYHAFSKMQLRKLNDISATIDELLQVTLKTFSTEQFRAWEDCSSALAALGSYKDLLVLQLRGPDSASRGSDPAAARLGRSDSQNSDFQEVVDGSVGAPPKSPGRTPGTPGRKGASAASNEGGPRQRSGEGSDVFGFSDVTADCYVNSGRDTASGFRATFFKAMPKEEYVAYHGRLNYYTTTRAEAHAGGVDFTEHSIWSEATVIVTYDRVMHLMQVPHDGSDVDELKFTKDGLIMSVNIRNVLVRPFAINREGYRDAFEVLLAGSGSKKMSLLGSLSSSSKEITAIIFLTDDSYQMRSWMRAISNPFVDTSRDPPDSPVPAAAPASSAQASSAPAAAASAPATNSAAAVDPNGEFSFGADADIVMGTNSLRDLGARGMSAKLTSGSTKAPLAASSALAAEPSASSFGGGDDFSGTNMLRTASFRTPSKAAAPAAPAGEGSFGGSAADSFGGTNLLRSASSKLTSAGSRSPGAPGSSAAQASELSASASSAGASSIGGGGVSAGVLGNSENFAGTNALRRLKKTPGMGSSMSNVLAGSGGATASAGAASGGAFAAALSGADATGTGSDAAPALAAADAGGDTVSL